MLLVMDSGIGGLSVAQAIRQLLPTQPMTYLADHGGFPYGDLTDEALTRRLLTLLDLAVAQVRPSALVIACNTASTVALPAIRARFSSLPVVGCVPPIKPAAELSRSRKVGLLATPATVRRAYVRDLVARYAEGCAVFSHGSATMAAQAEAVFQGGAPDLNILAGELEQMLGQPGAQDVDAVVLGCTHYAFLLPALRHLAPKVEHWLDPAMPVARQVRHVLMQHTGDASPDEQSSTQGLALLTASIPPTVQAGLTRYGFDRFRQISVPGPVCAAASVGGV